MYWNGPSNIGRSYFRIGIRCKMDKNQKKSNHSTSGFSHKIIKVLEVTHLGEHKLKLKFDNGEIKTVDLWPRIQSATGMFKELQDLEYFAKVAIDRNLGTITWPNGLDWAPDALFNM